MYVLINDKDVWTTVSSEQDNKALGLTQLLKEMNTRNISLGEILGASTFWNPKGLSRLVYGLLYIKYLQSRSYFLCTIM